MPTDPLSLAHHSLPALALATLALGIGLPLVRHRLRHGTHALVRPRSDLQRFLHQGFAATMLGYLVWTVALAILGPEALGVRAVPLPLAVAGVGVAASGLLLVIAAQAQMGRSWRIGIPEEHTRLVTTGLFRWTRNPIYLGMLLLAVGIGLTAPSGWTATGAVLVYVVIGFQARAEEVHLAARHGDDFREWAGRVGRLLPGVGRLRAEG